MNNSPVNGSGLKVAVHHFVRIRDLLTGYCGVCLSEDHRSRLGRVLARRLRACGLTDVAEYVKGLESAGSDEELALLVDEITNNETYFFREEFQLETLAEEVLPELVKRRRRRRLNIWSAGCSSGEEPLTVAMLIRDSPLWEPVLSHRDVRILGTDVSRRMIRRAREGRYPASSFKSLPAPRRRDIQRRYFQPAGECYTPRSELQEMISFLHLNLLDRDGSALFGEMDVILCRNVLMYFPAELRLRAIRGFYRKLSPAGYLLLGHSENLLGTETPFEARRLRQSLVYRKPAQRRAEEGSGWGP